VIEHADPTTAGPTSPALNSSLVSGLRLQCPACLGNIAATDEWAQCNSCGQAWPIRAGVVCFGESADFPQDVTDDQFGELLAVAENVGWQSALHDYLRLLDPAAYRRAADEYRAQWRCLLPTGTTSRLLDLRCGCGAIAASLADDCGLVVAADTRFAPARFAAIRAQAAGHRNVQGLSLDPSQRLPFPDGSFELAVVHETIEWADPALLKELARVLVNEGLLFLSSENRWNAARVLQPERHGPASQAPGLASPRPARPWSLPDWRHRLAAAGLNLRAAYGILPSAAEPFFIVPLSPPSTLKYFLDSLFGPSGLRPALARRGLLAQFEMARLAWNLVRWLPVESVACYLLPAYGVIAEKTG
jgi:SAM-dependent methyltransferase